MLLFNWENLSLLGKIYWILAIPSTAIFIILFVLSLFGADADTDGDAGGADVDISEGFGGFILSFKSIISFMMMFGWAGIIGQSFNLSIIITIVIAVVSGLVSLFAIAGLLYFFNKMSYSGTMHLENAIGNEGQVILHIPAKKKGAGQVQINIQGSLRTIEAVTEELEEIKSETTVLVIEIVNKDTLLVVPKR